MIRLFDFPRSSAAYRVRIALHLKGLAFDSILTDLRTGAQHEPGYRAVNPAQLVPALQIDGMTLTQSLAMIEYLDQRNPTPSLLPPAPAARAQVQALALAIACDIHPLNNLRVLNYLRQQLGQDEGSITTWYQHWIATGLATLETTVAQLDSRDYLHGGRLSLADVCLVPQMFNARRFNCDLAPYPRLVSIDSHLQSLPAFAAAHPDQAPA